MRIPFLKRRKQSPTLYQKDIENEFVLLKRAQAYIVSLFMGDPQPVDKLDFIFEQICIVYNLALLAGSHEVSDHARKALCMLRREYNNTTSNDVYVFNNVTAITCSKALSLGEAVLQELPRSEYKLAYVNAKKLSSSRDSIINYLKVFHD